MKITSKQFEQNLKQANKDVFSKLVLLHGDDSGLARNLAKRLTDLLINGDELAVEKISAFNIIEEPGCLYDSALAPSMFSPIKVILIEDFINLGQKQRKISDILSEFLNQQDNLESTYIIIPAIGLDSTSALVKKYEKDSSASSIRCFVDSNFDLKKVAQEFFSEKGKKIDPKALMFLQSSLGNDRMITLQELEKLDIYTLDNNLVTMQDCLDCIVSADSVNLFKFCDAIGLNDKNNAQKYLIMLEEEGLDYNMILSVLARHLKRLLIVKSSSVKNDTPITAEMGKLRPPVFFGKDGFIKQVENQNLESLESFVYGFFQLQKDARFNPNNSKSMIEQIIFKM